MYTRSPKTHVLFPLSCLMILGLVVAFVTPSVASEVDEDLLLLQRINRAFVKLVNRALPAIVQVETTKRLTKDPHRGIPGFPFRFRPPQLPRESTALGSGVIVSEDGYILTNNHVVEDAEDIQVRLADKRRFEAHLVGTDKYTEVAVIKIDAEGLPTLPLGDSDTLQVGEWVIAIGSPFRLEQTVTRGIVSAKGRSHLYIIDQQGYEDFIQTDAAINPGNSGGALINIRGELIGINTAILTGGLSRANAGVGFAVPINLARTVMEALIRDGRVIRGWLGVGIRTVDETIAEQLQLPRIAGALVTEVFPESPAATAGVMPNDVIVRFDGHPIEDTEALRRIVALTQVNRQVEMQIIRDGKPMTLQVRVGERTEDVLAQANQGHPDARPNVRPDQGPLVGIEVENLTPELARELGYEGVEGVIITRVDPDSPAAQAGLETGDLIQEVEMQDVRNTREFAQIVQKVSSQERVILYVRSRDGSASYRVIKQK